MTRQRLAPILVATVSIALGFALTAPGVATWDSLPHLDRSRWLVHMLGLPSSRSSNGLTEMMKWYGPLWALFLGLLSELVLPFLRDPLWVQQSFNFALFPTGLYGVYRLLLRAGEAPSTAGLAVALLLGAIRLGGHALVNVNDFPMAMLSLLVMLYLWNKLREVDGVARTVGRWPARTLALLGIVAVAPFLVRPPVLVELAILTGFFFICGRTTLRGSRWWYRTELMVIPLLAAALFGSAIWPSLWEHARKLPRSTAFLGFTRFDWEGQVRYFGHTSLSTHLPRLYPLFWLPVMMSPLAFAAFVLGILRIAVRRERAPLSLTLPTARRPITITLRRWLALHAALLWLGVLAIHPTLYDEERHLLFLYPPLLVLAALGLADLGETFKRALTVLVVVTSLVSYAGWGRYSYVYKSPLIGDRSANRFMGDYWGVCVPLAVASLQGRVPPGAEVVVSAPYDAALAEYQRLRDSRLLARAGFGPYQLVSQPSTPSPYFISYNRMGYSDAALQDVREGRATLIWQTLMPPGDPACVITHP